MRRGRPVDRLIRRPSGYIIDVGLEGRSRTATEYSKLEILAKSRLTKITMTAEKRGHDTSRTHRLEWQIGSPGDVFICHNPWARPTKGASQIVTASTADRPATLVESAVV